MKCPHTHTVRVPPPVLPTTFVACDALTRDAQPAPCACTLAWPRQTLTVHTLAFPPVDPPLCHTMPTSEATDAPGPSVPVLPSPEGSKARPLEHVRHGLLTPSRHSRAPARTCGTTSRRRGRSKDGPGTAHMGSVWLHAPRLELDLTSRAEQQLPHAPVLFV